MGQAVPLDDLPTNVAKALPYNHSALDDHAAKVEEQYGLPTGILRAIKNDGEKSNANQVSPKGARGVMQFMPGTAKEYGLSDPTDPVAAMDAAARYLAKAREVTGSDDPAVLAAAYNSGMNRSVLKAGGIPNIPETQAYAGRVANGISKYAPQSSTPANSKLVPADDLPDAPKAQAVPDNRGFLARTELDQIPSRVGNLVSGAIRGAGSIGATTTPVLAYDMLQDLKNGKGLSLDSNRQRRADMDSALAEAGADPNSWRFKLGKLGTEVAGTLGVGGTLGNVVRSLSDAPAAVAFANALSSGGFSTGTKLAPGASFGAQAANMGTRMAGGGVTGGVSAGMVDPDKAVTGTLLGALAPPVVAGLGEVGKYAGRAIKAIAQPFTDQGQRDIAGNIVSQFAKDGPTAVNTQQLVSGSNPTLAEATGNAGIARLQSAARDLRPNAFVEREAANAAARNAALDNVAGDAGKLDIAKGERSDVAKQLYGEAMKQGIDPANITQSVKDQITQLLSRPSIKAAQKSAASLAAEDGIKLADPTSLQGLHYTKLSLDSQIGRAVREGDNTLARSLMGTKDLLEDTMTKMSPAYAQARNTFAELSKPVNQMETLQGLKVFDSKGNITLSKIQNTLSSLEAKMSGPGTDTAKSLTGEQMNVLKAIRDDLLRAGNLSAGKSAGSNTFQNLATDRILTTMLPGKAGEVAKGKIGDVFGRVGKIAYGGVDEKIRNNLVDMALHPELAAPYLNPALNQIAPQSQLSLLYNQTAPTVMKALPALSTAR